MRSRRSALSTRSEAHDASVSRLKLAISRLSLACSSRERLSCASSTAFSVFKPSISERWLPPMPASSARRSASVLRKPSS
jgi:hypothetical protein